VFDNEVTESQLARHARERLAELRAIESQLAWEAGERLAEVRAIAMERRIVCDQRQHESAIALDRHARRIAETQGRIARAAG
jgi:hypothetical protein